MPVFILSLALVGATACDSGVQVDAAPRARLAAKAETRADADPAERPILAQPAASTSTSKAPVFKHYGVNPTIDTSEQSSSTFSIDLDTASYGLARRALESSRLPPAAAIRVEEFLQALKVGPAKSAKKTDIAIDAASTVSVQRPGYHVLRISIDAPSAGPKPLDLLVALDPAATIADVARVEGLVRATVDGLRPGDRLGIVSLGAKSRVTMPLTKGTKEELLATALRSLGAPDAKSPELELSEVFALLPKGDRNRTLAYVGPGDFSGPDGLTLGAMLGAVESGTKSGITTTVLGIGTAPYDDVSLERIANAGRGGYDYVVDPERSAKGLLRSAQRPLFALDGKVMVRFSPQAVVRYRLIGYENRSASRPGAQMIARRSGLRAGDSITALYEVKVLDPTKTWGSVEFAYAAPDGGGAQRVTRTLSRLSAEVAFADTDARSAVAIVGAAMAEKLRGSYWARTLTWDDIISLHEALPAPAAAAPEIKRLGKLLQAARSADARPDPFESKKPRADMDFDELPILE